MDGVSIVISITLFVVVMIALISNTQRIDRLRRRLNNMSVVTNYNAYRADVLISDRNQPVPTRSYFVKVLLAQSNEVPDGSRAFVVDATDGNSRVFVSELFQNTITTIFRPENRVLYRYVGIKSKNALEDPDWMEGVDVNPQHNFFLVMIQGNTQTDEPLPDFVSERELQDKERITLITTPGTLAGRVLDS